MNVYFRRFLLISITLFGLFGCIIGLIVFIRKPFPGRMIFITLALLNIASLFYNSIQYYFDYYASGIDGWSNETCKINNFLFYFLNSVTDFILAFISFERLFEIKYAATNPFKKKRFQILAIIIITIYNLILYSPVMYFISLVNVSNSTSCSFTSSDISLIVRAVDLINSVLISYLLIFIFSASLIYHIFKSRLRLLNLANQQDRIKLRRDIRFAFTLVLSNLAYFFLNSPHNIYHVIITTNNRNDLHDILYYLSWFSICIDFYILFFSNSIFKKEVLKIFDYPKFYIRR
jgi:hypothetical protein